MDATRNITNSGPDDDVEPDSEGDDMEEAIEVDENDADDLANDVEVDENVGERVYLPNRSADEGNRELECDESAYIMYHRVKMSYPCLSFDIVSDQLGDDRADEFPMTITLVAGTQADKVQHNNLMVMKLSNMNKGKSKPKPKPEQDDSDEDDSEDDDEEDEDSKPVLESAAIHHPGCVNRLKVTSLGGKPLVASWSETGRVLIWDISHPLEAVSDHHVMTNYVRNNEAPKPLFSFSGSNIEGYALAWSKLSPGTLVSGDCKKGIYLWKPLEAGTWHIDQRPYKGHTASVEDIQWSPNEANVMASCSADQSIRIWDVRAAPEKACMLTKEYAHDSDVNVIHWNHYDPLILSGGDDGHIKVWDLRTFSGKPPVCTFKHHVESITSVEWHPRDSSVYAASGADDQLTLWDLGVERDVDLENEDTLPSEVRDLPPQLLFIHQGQTEIKELHWHPQIPGVLISTAMTGFNVFRTISV